MVIFNALLNLRELKELYSGKPVCVCPLYKGVINTPKTYEATGNPIVLPEYKSLVKLKTTFSPKQAGTGDPSPDNIRPISGWDSVQVTRCGKNLLKLTGRTVQSTPADFQVASENTKYPIGDGYLYVGITGNGYWIEDYITEYDIADNSIYVNVTSSGYGIGMCVKIVPGATYVVGKDGDGTNAIISVLTTKKDGLVSRFTVINTNVNGNTFTAQDGEEWAIVIFRPNTNTPVTYQNPRLELGSTLTPYEPYQGSTTTLTLPETIYGGTVDAATGEGEKTWGFIASYNGEAIPGEWLSDRDVYEPGTTPTTGAQVAYKLATPEPFKVPQVTIPSLKGENTFFTNGENMDIIYKKEFFWGDEA